MGVRRNMWEDQPVGNVERNGRLKLEQILVSAVMRDDCVGRWEKKEE